MGKRSIGECRGALLDSSFVDLSAKLYETNRKICLKYFQNRLINILFDMQNERRV